MSFSQLWQRCRQPISLQIYNFLLALWLAVPLNIVFFERIYQLIPYRGFAATWLFLAAVMVITVCYFYLVMTLLIWRWNAKIMAVLFLFITGCTAYFCNRLGASIDAFQIQNAMQTDSREVFDLLSVNFALWFIGLVIIPIVVFCGLQIKTESQKSIWLKKLFTAVGCLVIIGGLAFIYYLDLASMFRTNRDLKGYLSPHNIIAANISYYKKLKPKHNLPLQAYGRDAKIQGTATAQPKLLVLVVGETARAESFALNGYARNTNPQLSQLPLINFSHASSCGTATAVSVPCMFSGMPRNEYNPQVAENRENLLDILQHAGYKVTWIENNSGCKGVCTRVENYAIPSAFQQKWCKDGECYDEILVDSLNDYLSKIPADDKTPRVIVLHQMGSHGPAYYKRSTPPYQHFKPFCNSNAIQGCPRDQLINVYDNSILYTDHVLAQIIRTLQQYPQYQSAFWYLSDHGESTGESGLYLHGAPYMFAPSQQTHIPMLMWFSPKWQQYQPKTVNCLQQQKDHTVGQDNLFPTVLSLLDINTQVKNQHLDLLQQCQAD